MRREEKGMIDGLVDIDGHRYPIIQIDNQLWTAENLRVSRYRNGDSILKVENSQQWIDLQIGVMCTFENDDSNLNTHGAIYNWFAVDDHRGLAPQGWRVASDEDWKNLERFLGMDRVQAEKTGYRGTDEGSKLKEARTHHWLTSPSLTSSPVGFNALPSGFRRGNNGAFEDLGLTATFWTSTKASQEHAWFRYLYHSYSDIYRGFYPKQYGFSVRLVQDC